MSSIQFSLCITTMRRFDPFLRESFPRYVAMLRAGIIHEIVVSDETGDDVDQIRRHFAAMLNEFPFQIRLYANQHILGVYWNKVRTCQYAAAGHFVALMDSDNFADEIYFRRVSAYINEKNIQVTDEAVICPTLLRPHFLLTQYLGRVFDRDAMGAEMRRIEADQPTQFGNLMGLLNAGNYVMTERTAKYVPVLEPDVTVEMVGAVDVAYIQWLRLKQMERYQIHAVQDHEYIHTVHGGSTYLQTREANEIFTETHMRPRLRAL